jgi:hypothetical protein
MSPQVRRCGIITGSPALAARARAGSAVAARAPAEAGTSPNLNN